MAGRRRQLQASGGQDAAAAKLQRSARVSKTKHLQTKTKSDLSGAAGGAGALALGCRRLLLLGLLLWAVKGQNTEQQAHRSPLLGCGLGQSVPQVNTTHGSLFASTAPAAAAPAHRHHHSSHPCCTSCSAPNTLAAQRSGATYLLLLGLLLRSRDGSQKARSRVERAAPKHEPSHPHSTTASASTPPVQSWVAQQYTHLVLLGRRPLPLRLLLGLLVRLLHKGNITIWNSKPQK